MLLSLLLQTTVTKTVTIDAGILPAVYGTLLVGVLSFLASIAAIIVNRGTATRVANLAHSTSQEVASLSAQVSRETAGLAAQTARELKATDYKNDFYKKLLEKRLAAWAEAEQFTKHLALITNDVKKQKSLFSYFTRPEAFIKIVDTLNDSIFTQVIWIGGDYIKAVVAFRAKMLSIYKECYLPNSYDENRHARIDTALLWEAGRKHFDELNSLYTDMAVALLRQLNTLHDIEGFLDSLQDVDSGAPAPELGA